MHSPVVVSKHLTPRDLRGRVALSMRFSCRRMLNSRVFSLLYAPLTMPLVCCHITRASDRHPVCRGESQEAKRGPPCGHCVQRTGGVPPACGELIETSPRHLRGVHQAIAALTLGFQDRIEPALAVGVPMAPARSPVVVCRRCVRWPALLWLMSWASPAAGDSATSRRESVRSPHPCYRE
jgi:hypothetical protein